MPEQIGNERAALDAPRTPQDARRPAAARYTRFGQAREERRYGLGWRLDRRPGDTFALDLGVWRRERATERPEHGVGLDLRLGW